MMPGANTSQDPEEHNVFITEALIIKRNLSFPEDEDLSEKISHSLADLQTVRLDREKITNISNLEKLQNLHSLYLQGNKIKQIENLSCIPSLRFLSLAGNLIKRVENLRDLPYLQFLDLSDNLIDTLQLEEFPQSLLILNLIGNSCTHQNDYKKQMIQALPLLLDLDGQRILERWTSEDEDETSVEENDEDLPELIGPFCTERGFFRELEKELARHQERRKQEALLDHQLRMDTHPVLTALPPLLPGPPAGQSDAAIIKWQEQETPSESVSEPPATSSQRSNSQVLPSQPSTEQARKESRAAVGPKAFPTGISSSIGKMQARSKK
ncbi:leucine-rich repeat-containing protein 46 [Suncus etruscus]|uniref:leucine-rich repeat-containing protein 46 n=1 Tax=Suncus etruscus TaxID=109475 RepID=UPI00210FD873|nr:leucine-rich repeat-containing protein 46 [Suncus etruscus]